MTDDTQQTHPLYAIDRDQIDAVLGHEGEPGPQQLTTIAALFSRYADFPALKIFVMICRNVSRYGDFRAMS